MRPGAHLAIVVVTGGSEHEHEPPQLAHGNALHHHAAAASTASAIIVPMKNANAKRGSRAREAGDAAGAAGLSLVACWCAGVCSFILSSDGNGAPL